MKMKSVLTHLKLKFCAIGNDDELSLRVLSRGLRFVFP